jgi:hypothetical protein
LLRTYRGNQHVKLKLQLPKTVTPRQRQLLEEFENPNAGAASTTQEAGAEAKKSNSSFTIEQAWKRVKNYWSSVKEGAESAADTKASKSSVKDKDTASAGASGSAEAKAGEDQDSTVKAKV